MTNVPGDNPIKDLRAFQAYDKAIREGFTHSEASELAEIARHSTSGYYKTAVRKGHAELRRNKLEIAWQAMGVNGEVLRNVCPMCEQERQSSLFRIAVTLHSKEVIGAICSSCYNDPYPQYRLKISSNAWRRIRSLKGRAKSGLQALLRWRLSTADESKAKEIEEYVLEHY